MPIRKSDDLGSIPYRGRRSNSQKLSSDLHIHATKKKNLEKLLLTYK